MSYAATLITTILFSTGRECLSGLSNTRYTKEIGMTIMPKYTTLYLVREYMAFTINLTVHVKAAFCEKLFKISNLNMHS